MKKIFSLVGFCMAAMMAFAGPVSERQALNLAVKFSGTKAGQALQRTYIRKAPARNSGTENNLFYVFNRGNNQGYVVIAGDDRVRSVLAYSDEGELTEADINNHPSIKWLYDEYGRTIQWAIDNLPDVPSKEFTNPLTKAPEIQIPPLLAVNSLDRTQALDTPVSWGQAWPFNQYCPNYRYNGNVYPTVSGCVATAVATVMRWHKWPRKAVGSYSYYWKNTTRLSVNFDGVGASENQVYDWSQMPAGVTSGGYDRVTGRRLTDTQADNIGRLLRDVGYTIQMDYNPAFTGGSGAYVYNVPRALREHFGYKRQVQWQRRFNFTTARWQQEVRDEMRDYGPVIYAGYSRGGGHCFVLDGFATEGYVHVDWGWNASSNGWHLLDVLEPGSQGIGGGDGAFSSGHEMLRFVEPDRPDNPNPDPDPDPDPNPGVEEKVGESLYIYAKSATATLAQANYQPVTVTVGNNNATANYADALALAIYREGDANSTIVATSTAIVPAKGKKAVTFYANLANVKAGKYNLTVNWKDGSIYRAIDEVAGTVTIGNVEPDPDPDPNPVVLGPVLQLESSVNATGEVQKSVKVEIPVTNTGDQDYDNYLKLYAVSRTNYTTTLISEGDVKIAKSQRATVTFYSNEAYKQLPAGNYYLKLSYNKNNNEEFLRVSNSNLIGSLEITKQEEVQPVSHDIKMSTAMFYQNGYYLGQDNSTMNKKNGNLTARVYLKSTNGFKGQIYVYLTPYYNGNSADNGLGGYQNIEVGSNTSGYVNVVFTSSLMRYSKYYVNILYKAEGATGWLYYPGDAVPFYVTGFYEYRGDDVNNPTMGPTFDFDEMPSEPTQASIVVGSNTDGGDVTAISEFSETTADFGVSCNGDLYIISDKAGVVGIYTTAGAKVMTVNVKAGMNKVAGSALANGMYVAKMGNKAMKFVKK
ncbi:MAG: C10 family peptidase [Prevotellaceae bacterium]|nr:C10 family peptidase [Prevotella sp.]MDD7530605.1 C10 family peptidase [Prevotellaceae bacterium]